ncbi:hypothetical protein LCGC14_3115360 [marine sediment metagenome]|uniref:Uncharacterized protein n=1 Tax=marine sediment metagenome TaxID=412755 RepID=A0A0F8WSW6_9ZZZZ
MWPNNGVLYNQGGATMLRIPKIYLDRVEISVVYGEKNSSGKKSAYVSVTLPRELKLEEPEHITIKYCRWYVNRNAYTRFVPEYTFDMTKEKDLIRKSLRFNI